ncbi:MAG: restriction endonuclease subunit S [Bacilli bacterium]|nr:restriction endonuclease subunit S [Bacilli bacterium]
MCYYEKVGNNAPVLLENLPFEIPESWAWARLEQAAIINPRNNIGDDITVSFVEMKSLKDGFNNGFTYEEREWATVKNGFTHFQNNDVGFAKITPCFQNRKSCVFQHLINGYGAGTTELHILRAYYNTILPEYLLWFVKSPYFIEYGKQKFSGTAGQQRFGTNEMKNTFIPIPPYKEQVKIVARINLLLSEIMKDEA